MAKQRTARVQDLVGLLNALYPPSWAEEWDNVGLQVGDPAAEVSRVLVCLDPDERALEAAAAVGAQALVSHHPLIFRPLKRVVPSDETGRVACRALRDGVAVISAHTNLDRAPEGLNTWLAQRLGVDQAIPLASGGGDLLKLAVFVPRGYESQVAEALFAAGAGSIGDYDHCSFRSEGVGTFRPGAGAEPFVGRQGVTEKTAEVRLETVVPGHLVSRVLARMLKAHPYEEVAYDLLPLANRRTDLGLGRIGRLPEATTLGAFAEQVKRVLGNQALRVVGDVQSTVAKVALCGGSGASLLAEADRQGADVLVTGDIKYHEARDAESRGIALIDAGHFATEHLAVRELARVLRQEADTRGMKIEIQEMEGEADPFRVI